MASASAGCHRRDPPPLPQPPRRPGAGADRRRDRRGGRGGPGRAGPRRDDDRAAHAPGAREGLPGPLQRAARLHPAARHGGRQGGRRLLPQLRSRPAVRAGAAQPVRPEDRRADRHHRRDRHHRHAHRRRHRDRRQAPGAARIRRCSATSARAAPRTGTCACSIRSSSSTRSASIRAGRKAATRSRARLRARPAARRSSSPRIGSRACAAPTSSSRRRGSRSPSRC